MSIDDVRKKLEIVQVEYRNTCASLKHKVMLVQAQYDALLIEEEAARLLEGMSDEQKIAVAQAISAQSINSTSEVGTPGRN